MSQSNKVLADGTILLNDKQVVIDELKIKLQNSKKRTVWFGTIRKRGGEPPPQAMSVMEAVVDAKPD
ncbi:MAG: hypothetical protein R3C20_02745 [Planctomycetaceae bacterium]